MPNTDNPLFFCLSIVGIHRCKSKCMTRNKKSLIMAAKSSRFYNVPTNELNSSGFLIPVSLTKNIHNCKNKRANTKKNDNIQKGIPSHICSIKYQRYRKSCKIMIKSNSDKNNSHKSNIDKSDNYKSNKYEGNKNKKSNIIDKKTKCNFLITRPTSPK